MDGNQFFEFDSQPSKRLTDHVPFAEGATAANLVVDEVSWGPRGLPPILNRTSFSLEAGTVLGVLGPNGAGKSTLLRLIYGYIRPRTGRILLDGADTRCIRPGRLALDMAVVLQEQPAEYGLTVREIIKLGRLPHRNARIGSNGQDEHVVDCVLDRLELSAIGNRLVTSLSGGEKQRVSIARALAQEPRILLLDEPTNHLDIRHRLETLEILRELGLTVVCSLHDLNAAIDFADELLLLCQGDMLAFGPPSQVLTPELVSEAFSVNAVSGCERRSDRPYFHFNL